MRVGISGGTGLIGKSITHALVERGDEVVIFSRRNNPPKDLIHPSIRFLPRSVPTPDDINELDAVINLAGENLAGVRWTNSAKEKFRVSRVDHTRGIVQSIQNAVIPPKVFISASAIGYYGSSEETGTIYTEDSRSGQGFLADLSVDWEGAAWELSGKNSGKNKIRIAIPRIGIVLDPTGGALAKLVPVFNSFVGGPIGAGKQGMSWIHRDDLVNAFLYILDTDTATGVFNLTAPNPVTNGEFSQILGSVLGRPHSMWTPTLAIRVLFGEGAAVVTEGQVVIPERLTKLGFEFEYPMLEGALRDLLKK